MSGRGDDNHLWMLVDRGVAIRVENGTIEGLVIYGDITADRLRSVSLKTLRYRLAVAVDRAIATTVDKHKTRPARFPEWRRDRPPTRREVEAAAADLPESAESKPPIRGKMPTNSRLKRKIAAAAVRRRGESATDFYARFAAMYSEVSASTPFPSAEISRHSGLSPNVVKQYVHRARGLGLLPPAQRRRS